VEHLIGRILYAHATHQSIGCPDRPPFEPSDGTLHSRPSLELPHTMPRIDSAMEMTVERNSHLPRVVLIWLRLPPMRKLVAAAEVCLYNIAFVLLLGGNSGILCHLACHRYEYICTTKWAFGPNSHVLTIKTSCTVHNQQLLATRTPDQCEIERYGRHYTSLEWPSLPACCRRGAKEEQMIWRS
jgi:hypothetical protein